VPLPDKTTLLDIYEAAGARVSEDRTMVHFDSGSPLKPFEIVLTVFPQSIRIDGIGGPEVIEFGVLLHDEVSFEEVPYMGHKVIHHNFDANIEIPASQVRILKKEQERNAD
jgi:hypothetical protein